MVRINLMTFNGCSNLKDVFIPESITYIDHSAFGFCVSLVEIVLPSNITNIRANVFEGCSNLESISLHEGITSIENSAFKNCKSLKEIVIPSSVKTIADEAFAECKGLEKVMLLSDKAPTLVYVKSFPTGQSLSMYHKENATGFDKSKWPEIWGSANVTVVSVSEPDIIRNLTAKSENSDSICLSWDFSETASDVYASGIPLIYQIFYKTSDDGDWIEYTGTINIDINTPNILLNDIYDNGPTEFRMIVKESILNQSVEIDPVKTMYTITWNIDGIESTEDYEYGVLIEVPEGEKGYRLDNVPDFDEMPAKDLVISASWEQIEYTVFFENEDGSDFQASITNKHYGDTVTIPELPPEIGYAFGKWFVKGTDAEITDSDDIWNFLGQSVEDSITLKANYEPITYTIKFESKSGILDTVLKASIGETLAGFPSPPSEIGYIFEGWYIGDTTIKDGTSELSEDFILKSDETVITAVAKYKISVSEEFVRDALLDVIYHNGTVEITYVYDEVQTPLRQVVLDELFEDEIEYTVQLNIEGEVKDCILLLTGDFNGKDAGNYTIYVRLVDEEFSWNEEVEANDDVLEIGWIITPKSIAHSDIDVRYEYDGNTDTLKITDGKNALTGDVDYELMFSTGMLTVCGKGNYKDCTNHRFHIVTFSGIPGDVEQRLQIVNKVVAFPIYTVKNGYEFIGWFGTVDSEEREANAENIWDFVDSGSIFIELTAVYEPIKYTISFSVGEGSSVSKAVVEFDSEIDWNDYVSTRYGYSLKWLYDGDDVEDVLVKMTVADDIEVVAEWTPNKYEITFDTDGGSKVNNVIVEFDSEINWDSYVSANEGHSLKWLYDGNDVKDVLAKMTVADDIEVVAEWTLNKYTITLVLDNDEDDIVITQYYNTEIDIPENPTREGYTFERWSLDVPDAMPANDLEITAEWKINEYTIYFDTGEGNVILPIVQDYNTEITEPDSPVRAGYTFEGWDKGIPAKMPVDGLTVKAVWKLIVYDEPPTANEIEDIITANNEPVIRLDVGTEVLEIDNEVFENIGLKPLVIDVVDKDDKVLYSWTFSGDYVENAGIFKTKITEKEDAEEVKEAIKSSKVENPLVLNFSASGILPKEASVKYYVGTQYDSGTVLSLFFFDEDENKLVNQNQVLEVDDDGYVTFTLTHCSMYVIGEVIGADEGIGSYALYIGVAIALIIAVVAVVFVMNRRS